jgi:hypothetical protein
MRPQKQALCFITCADFPRGTEDDQLLFHSFENRDISVTPVVWDKRSPDELGSFAATIIRSPWDYHQKIKQMYKWLEKTQSLKISLFNPAQLILWNISKKYLPELEKKQIPIVPTLILRKMSDQIFAQEIQKRSWSDIVIKPEISASAFKTFRLKLSELENYWTEISSIWQECEVLVQPYCGSIESEGEYSLMYFNDSQSVHYSHTVIKKPKVQDFRVQQEHGGTVEAFTAPQALVNYGRDILKALPFDWLYVRVDVMKYEGNYVLGELELFEPQLFFRYSPEAAPLFVQCVLKRLEGQ